jgi:hypothetical protein
MTPIKPKFKRGDIIISDYGNAWIVSQVYDQDKCYDGFDHIDTYSLDFDSQDKFKKIGEFPLQTIKDAIDDAKRQSLDLQTQVNIALSLMDKFLEANNKDSLLVSTDMRVDKDENIVSVRCSDGIGRPDKWMSVVDICEDYGVDKHGVQ